MLPAEIVRDFDTLYGVESAILDEQLRVDIGRTVSQFNARGALHSSTACLSVAQRGNESLAGC